MPNKTDTKLGTNSGYAPVGFPVEGTKMYDNVELNRPTGIPGNDAIPDTNPQNRALNAVATIYRGIIAALALYSAFIMLRNGWNDGSWDGLLDQALYFTTLSVIAVGVVYLGLTIMGLSTGFEKIEGRRASARGLAVLMSVMTGIIFAALLDGTYPEIQGLLAHLVVPILVAVDWLLVGRNQERVPWVMVGAWTLILSLYLGAYYWDATRGGRYGGPMYDFFDPSKGNFLMWLGIMYAAFILCAILLIAIGRLRGAIRGSGEGATGVAAEVSTRDMSEPA